MKELLPVVINQSTGSVFYEIANTDVLSVSFRIWKEELKPSTLPFGFRVRVEVRQDAPTTPMNLFDFAKKEFPNFNNWATRTSKYLSLAGVATMPMPSSLAKAVVLEDINNSDLIPTLWGMLTKSLEGAHFTVSEEAFRELCLELVEEDFDSAVEGAKKEAVVITFNPSTSGPAT